MWGLIMAVVAFAIASDCEVKIKKLQDRLWHDEQLIKQLREQLTKQRS